LNRIGVVHQPIRPENRGRKITLPLSVSVAVTRSIPVSVSWSVTTRSTLELAGKTQFNVSLNLAIGALPIPSVNYMFFIFRYECIIKLCNLIIPAINLETDRFFIYHAGARRSGFFRPGRNVSFRHGLPIRAKLLDSSGTYAVRKSMSSTTIRFHPRRQPGNSLGLHRQPSGCGGQ